jgi:DNA-directed RNA polymerase sigma subunit (sigma70/sigma32)
LVERAALGDRASQERLVAANLAMVIRLAETRADRGLPVGDLVQEGSVGLVEALRTFAAGDFGAFAEQKAGEQMDAALAAESAAVRDAELLVAAASDYERTEILLHKLHKRPATVAEMAEKLEWTVERTRYVAKVVADARLRHDEELLAFIDPDSADPDGPDDGE